MPERLKSRKLWVTVAGIGVVIICAAVGVEQETAKEILIAVAVVVGSFNVGQGIADGTKQRR